MPKPASRWAWIEGLAVAILFFFILIAIFVVFQKAHGVVVLQKERLVIFARIPHSKDVDAQLRKKLEEMGWKLFNEGCRKTTDTVVLKGGEVFITLVCEERR